MIMRQIFSQWTSGQPTHSFYKVWATPKIRHSANTTMVPRHCEKCPKQRGHCPSTMPPSCAWDPCLTCAMKERDGWQESNHMCFGAHWQMSRLHCILVAVNCYILCPVSKAAKPEPYDLIESLHQCARGWQDHRDNLQEIWVPHHLNGSISKLFLKDLAGLMWQPVSSK